MNIVNLFQYIFLCEQCRQCRKLVATHYEFSTICSRCKPELTINQMPLEFLSLVGGAEIPVISALVYEGLPRKLVRRLKYEDDRLVAEDLAVQMSRCLRENFVIEELNPLLIPVPLSKKRLKERGFNQAKLLSEKLSEITGITMSTNVLSRSKETLPQHHLSKAERKENLQGAFALLKFDLAPFDLVLVDDVYTSGATLAEAAATLAKGNPASVRAICAARAT